MGFGLRSEVHFFFSRLWLICVYSHSPKKSGIFKSTQRNTKKYWASQECGFYDPENRSEGDRILIKVKPQFPSLRPTVRTSNIACMECWLKHTLDIRNTFGSSCHRCAEYSLRLHQHHTTTQHLGIQRRHSHHRTSFEHSNIIVISRTALLHPFHIWQKSSSGEYSRGVSGYSNPSKKASANKCN